MAQGTGFGVAVVLLLACVAASAEAEALNQLRTRYDAPSDAVLVRDGTPDFVVAAPKGWYRELAREVVRAVLGREDPTRIVEATATPPLDRTHVITLGCMAENPLLFRLYWNKYTRADLVMPGPGKARIEVVCDPYPWCAGKNVVVLGGSDEAGVKLAVAHFVARLQRAGGLVTYPWEVYQSDARPSAPGSVAMPSPVRFDAFNNLAGRFVQTTDDACALKAFEVLEQLSRLYGSGERKDFDYVDECNSPETFALWDVVEHHPALSPDARLRYADLLYSVLLRGLPSHTYEWGDLAAGPKLVWNHTGVPLFGIYRGARYFSKHYPEAREFTADALKRCERAFTTQMGVWKPREDAQHYYQLAFHTVMDYCAGEWRLDYLENGNLRRMANYATVVSDNRGWGSGFGDAEPLCTNATELAVLDKAFAWLRDPGIPWRLNRITNGSWRNRYTRDVKPEPPPRLAKIQAVPVPRGIYDVNQTDDGYGGSLPPTTVPVERTFDKISLRESFDPMAQYLLLDGFSSGMHRHYDANMIVRFADRGRVWLIDDDYLVSQTTDHTGISLLRAGRNTERMPTYASLEAVGDFPRVGLVRTRLAGYNGADWIRDILWRKGRYLLVRDEVRPPARENALVFSVLKLHDAGQVRFDDDGAVRSTQPEGSSDMPEATLTVLPAVDVAASLARRRSNRTDIPSARLVQRLATRDGKPAVFRNLAFVSDPLESIALEMRPLGEGYVAVRGKAESRTRLPTPLEGKAYNFSVPPSDRYRDTDRHMLTDGIHPSAGDTLTGWVAWRDESPTITVDLGRVEKIAGLGILVMGGNEWGIRFPTRVSLEAAGKDGRFAPAGEVRPAWPEAGSRYAERVLFPDLNRAVRQIRLHFECPAGGFVFLGEIWATGGAVYSRPATEGLDAVLGSGRLALPGIEVDADLAYLSPTELAFTGARSLKVGGASLKVAPTACLQLSGLPSGKALPAAVRAAIRRAFAGGRPGRFQWEASEPANVAAAFRTPGDDAVQAFPVDDGKAGFVVGFGSTVCRLDAALQEVWRADLPALVASVGAGDLDGDGRPEVFAGTVKDRLHCFDEQGKEQWQWEVDPKVIEWAGWAEKSWVEQIRVADVNDDGRPELVLGCKNSRLFVLDRDRKTLWNYGFVYHGCRDLQVVDLDGDGKKEILAANRYGSVTRHDGATGKVISSYGTEISDTFVVCPAPAEGCPPVLFGSSAGRFAAHETAGKALWRFDNQGFGALGAAFAGGRVWLASESGLLYALNPKDGAALWRHDFGAAVTHVLPDGEGAIALDARGGVWQVTATQEVTPVGSTGAPALQVLLTGGRLYVLTAEGLSAISPNAAL